MQLSESGINLLRELEGVEPEPYRDSAGLLTIGAGHLMTRDEISSGKIYCGDTVIRWKNGPLSDEEIDAILAEDVGWAEAAVEVAVRIPLTQAQFDCLVLFAYNVGPNAFRQSTLCRVLNDGNYAGVPAQLARWCHAGGQVVHGLVTRRAREADLWNTDTGVTRA